MSNHFSNPQIVRCTYPPVARNCLHWRRNEFDRVNYVVDQSDIRVHFIGPSVKESSMTTRNDSMAIPLKFRALIFGSGLAGISLLAGLAQTGSAEASSNPSRCTSSSRQATVACCEQLYGNNPPVLYGQRNRTCAQAVICKISLFPLTKVAFPQRCSINPLMKDTHRNKGLKLHY